MRRNCTFGGIFLVNQRSLYAPNPTQRQLCHRSREAQPLPLPGLLNLPFRLASSEPHHLGSIKPHHTLEVRACLPSCLLSPFPIYLYGSYTFAKVTHIVLFWGYNGSARLVYKTPFLAYFYSRQTLLKAMYPIILWGHNLATCLVNEAPLPT